MINPVSEMTFDSRDEFQRKAVAEKVIGLLRSDVDVSPMVIDGSWGTGKTEFCHKLINLMAVEDTHHLIYVDAFQADHADEPLLTVLAEVLKILPEGENREGLIKKALPAIRYGLKTVTKAGVAHLLRQDVADLAGNFDKEIQQTADKAIDASVEALLKDHVQASESLVTLQSALTDIAKAKPIILFIDELDRCRPNFGVNMLEVIKHAFAVKGVQFVFITNTQQLKASINHCYGQTVDSHRYLDKFIKFSFGLPQINDGDTFASETHYTNLIRKSSELVDSDLDASAYIDLIFTIIRVHKLSLREVETLVRYMEVYKILSGGKGLHKNVNFGYQLLRAMGIALFCISPKITEAMTRKKADAKELAAFFGETHITQVNEGYIDVKPYQIAVTMIAQECLTNSQLFQTEEEEHRRIWNRQMASLFNGGVYYPREGERSDIVIQTFNTLCLNVS